MDEAVKMHQQGRSVKEISRALRISEVEFYRLLVAYQKEVHAKSQKAAQQITNTR